jgi:hypothetical protein
VLPEILAALYTMVLAFRKRQIQARYKNVVKAIEKNFRTGI